MIWTEQKRVVKIYTLSDKNGNIFYVGCTAEKLDVRLKAHLLNVRTYPNSEKAKYFAAINNEVIVKAVYKETVSTIYKFQAHRKIAAKELEYIYKYTDLGHPLVNREARLRRMQNCIITQPTQTPH